MALKLKPRFKLKLKLKLRLKLKLKLKLKLSPKPRLKKKIISTPHFNKCWPRIMQLTRHNNHNNKFNNSTF